MTPLLIADGDIPTTGILTRALAEGYGEVETRPVGQLFGAEVGGRPVFISRLCHPSYDWLPRHLARRGVRYAYFLDDNFWALTEDVDPALAAFYQHPAVRDVLDAYVRSAQVTLVMSRRLGDYVRARHPGVPVEYVVPGFDVAGIEALRRSVRAGDRLDGITRIAYPTSRRPAIAPLLVPVIRSLVERFAGTVEIEFVGWAPDEVLSLPHVRLHPHIADYEQYLAFALSRRWAIGIAPLAGDPFEAFKTQVKYREYAGCGVAGVYSRLPPYVDYVEHGRTGVLVDNTVEAWVDGIARLVSDAELRRRIASAAYADVLQNFNQSETARQLVRIGSDLLNAPASDVGVAHA